ncbi:MAG: hypothetical protein JO356_03725, partial [Acidobacteria bacterium]|nr:hypothetical protein [Acidobacteriota bacterium]
IVEGRGTHNLAVGWHFAPGMIQQQGAPPFFISPHDRLGIALLPADGTLLQSRLCSARWSPAYGRCEPAVVWTMEKKGPLPQEIATLLVPARSSAEVGRLTAFSGSDSSPLQVYCYSTTAETHRMVFAAQGQNWHFAEWASDAEFLYLRETQAGVEEISFCQGSFVEFGGRRLASAKTKAESCELRYGQGIVSSQPAGDITVGEWPPMASLRAVLKEPAIMRLEN